MRGVHQEHHRKPERPAEGPAAARGPCAGVRHGAQRRHASPDPIDPPGRHLRPDPLPPGRHADDGAPSRPAAGEHPGGGDAPRQQRLRHPASGGGGGGLLPGKRPAVPAGHRPDRRGLPHRHGGHGGGRPGLHRPQGADGSPGHRGLPAAAGAGRGAGAAAVRRHRQRQPLRGGSVLPAGPVRGRDPEPAGDHGPSRGPDLAGGNRHRRHPGP